MKRGIGHGLAVGLAVALGMALFFSFRRSNPEGEGEGFRASKCYDCEQQISDLGYPTLCFDCEAQNAGRRLSGQSALDYQLGMGGGSPKMFAGA